MDLQFNDNKFVLTNLDYEMMQIILNGITCERMKLAERISYLTSSLFVEDYSVNLKNEYRIYIDYLNHKNKELTKIVNDINLKFEGFPLID